MMKNVIALAATALFSLNASASYTMYDIAGDDRLSGYFIQNDEDLSIAAYTFIIRSSQISHSMQPGMHYGNVMWAQARYNNQGPTRFGVYDARSEAYYSEISFNFSATQTPGTYSFTSYFTAVEDFTWPDWADELKPVTHYFSGTVSGSPLSAGYADLLDTSLAYGDGYYLDGVNHIAPKLNAIPEPTSLALFICGAAGLVSGVRRRKSSK
ncbi:PEP-CTERM sorting domain-containing protein [Massilia sp. YIM B02769]|uniref:PEP-CTERM sorting domain-containing protein n=1 Tax=Massilia sp. YIM B02769 TaxID=3050129 RepID=UPI0025B6C56A|nr:PEP-CTERM sorting domain-containing protein [Massilia sp. YIM B02769]MDN4060060.1 PEP-CTERM sorting domain-containing protein [Massilia sp. YIM B02769]